MIVAAATTTTSNGFNPLTIFGILQVPFGWVLRELVSVFTHVSILQSIGAFGLAVIVLTIGIRAVLFPVFGWQLRTSRRIQAEQRLVAPQLQELRKKYKKEPQRLSQEMNALYKEHGISPFSSLTGCIPALVQMPVLIGLYQSVRSVAATLATVDKHFLWIHDVSVSASAACCSPPATHAGLVGALSQPQLLILPLIAGLFTFAQSRMMMPPSRPDMSDQERSMQGVTRQMSFIFPVMIFVFSFLFPQGLAIYWATGTIFMVAQQYHLLGWNGLVVPSWFPGAKRVTALTIPRTPVKTGAGAKKTTVVATSVKNGSRNGTKPASANGTKPDTSEDEPPVRSQSATARSLARPNRPNRRRRRR
jgi:YidC/Oxa1 family membrane protein insertase